MGVIDEALQAFALGPCRSTPLAESFNLVSRIDGAAGTFVLRIGPVDRVHADGSAEAEAIWLAELAAAGAPAPRVVRTAGGAAATTLASGAEAMLLTWTAGVPAPRPVSAADTRDLAGLSARLHAASRPRAARPAGALDGRRALLFELPDALDELPAGPRRVLRAGLVRAQDAVDALWAEAADEPRLLHGDLTPANALRTADGLAPIDFQDLFWGHPAQDLAHTIFGLTRGVDVEAAVSTFRVVYEATRRWPDAAWADLIVGRRVSMVNLAVHRRRPGLAEYAAHHAAAIR